MVYAKTLLPALVVLLLVAVATLRRTGAAPDRSRALAQLGFGLAKLCLLALPLEWLSYLFQNGEPLAVSGKAVWLAALAQTCQLYLVITGSADVVAGISALRGRVVAEMHHSAFRAGHFGNLWRRLLPGLVKGSKSGLISCVPALLLIAGVAALWHGSVLGSLLWLVIQLGIVFIEDRRGKPLFAPLPLPLRVILVMLVLVVSNVMLVSPGFVAALENVKLMFASTKPMLYSLLLDKRLTSGWLQFMLLFSVIASIGLPRLGWVLEQPIKSWHAIGILLIPCSLLMATRDSAYTPAILRQITQWPVTWVFDQGNSRVHVGYDGWLFPLRELDRLTLRRRGEGATEALVKLAGELKTKGIPLMLVAVPAKAAMHPDQIFRAEYATPVQPPGQKARLEKLAAAGIDVIDPSLALWDRLIKAESHYATDRHWTFDTMKVVAGAVAKRIQEKWPQLPGTETPVISATILDRTEAGDLARNLLPLGSETVFGEESEQLVSILGLESDGKSPVMILGGESLRVFSDASSSFGNVEGKPQHAGFGTQISSLLGRRLDVRAANELEAAQIAAQAAGKKLIVILARADEL